MLSEIDELLRKRASLIAWWRLKDRKDSQDGLNYTPHINVSASVCFRGQEYAGAKNYHEAPTEFEAAFKKTLETHAMALLETTFNNELARLNEGIRNGRDKINKLLESIDNSTKTV